MFMSWSEKPLWRSPITIREGGMIEGYDEEAAACAMQL